MISTEEKKNIVINRVNELIEQFKQKKGSSAKHTISFPDVLFTIVGRVAGNCSFDNSTGTGVLNFNTVLMEENWETFIEHTVSHEVAHFCTNIYFGFIYTSSGRRQSHGKDWKNMMRFFGVKEISRCHKYRLDNVKQTRKTKRFLYECNCGYQHQIATPTHNKIRYHGQKRICKTCCDEIRFVKRIK